jgi:uncharacterized membrane protein YedE/YeeE
MIKLFIIMFIFTAIVSYVWVSLITNMDEKHNDYKGDDFLNW